MTATITRFGALSDPEILALASGPADAVADSIRSEALHRGFKVPVTMPEVLRTNGYLGLSLPADTVPIYVPNFGGSDGEVGYLTEALAKSALSGAVWLRRSWSENLHPYTFSTGAVEARVSVVYTGQVRATLVAASEVIDTPEEGSPGFEDLARECYSRLTVLRQNESNRARNVAVRAEYLRLANGDASIAAAFWLRTKGTRFPEEDGTIPDPVENL